MDRKCFTCLSSDRKLSLIGDYRRTFELILANTSIAKSESQRKDIRVCWECKAIIKNCHEFTEKVQRAQTRRMLQLDGFEEMIALSTLGVSEVYTTFTNDSLDEDFYHNIPIKEEVIEGGNLTDLKYLQEVTILDDTGGIQQEIDNTSITEVIPGHSSKRLNPKLARVIKRSSNGKNVKIVKIIPMKASCKVDSIENVKHFNFNDGSDSDCEDVIEKVDESVCDNVTSVSESNNMKTRTFNVFQDVKDRQVIKAGNRSRKNLIFDHPIFDTSDKFKLVVMSRAELKRVTDDIVNSARFQEREMKCEKCAMIFLCKRIFEKHMQTHAPKPGCVKCEICSVYISTAMFSTHTNRHLYKYVCLLCNHATYFKSDNAWQHYNDKHFEGPVKCSGCEKEFSSIKVLRKHLNAKHRFKAFCELCKKGFVIMEAYKIHMENHGPENLHPCSKCDVKCATKKEYETHYRKAHPSKYLSTPGYCVECDKQFVTLFGYRNHLQYSKAHARSGDSTYECHDCGKKFLKKNLIISHMRLMHSGVVKQCHLCSQQYRLQSRLNRHIKIIHEGYVVPKTSFCQHCGKAFESEKQLRIHAVKHTKARPYKCDMCTKDFGFYSALYTHKKLVHHVPKKKDLERNQAMIEW